jgi:NAD-dependent SIR2 family protein deacetylase
MRLIHEKQLLKRVFTQNVDTLEQIAGLDEEMIVAAHGSFATATCMNCKKKFQAEELKSRIATGEVLRCQEKKCKGKHRALIKSDIVCESEYARQQLNARSQTP